MEHRDADIEALDAPTERDLICPCGHGLQAHTWTGCQAYVPPTIGRAGAGCCTRTPPEVVLASDWLAEQKRAAAERAYSDGYNDAATMARCYGHTDHWPAEDEPRNPYRNTPEGGR